MNVIVAITGASGSVYARQVLQGLSAAEAAVERIGLIVSRRGAEVAEWEGVVFPDFLFSSERTVCKARDEAGRGVYPGVNDKLGDERNETYGALSRKFIERFDNDDMFASPASGSAHWDAMVIVPCSMGCVGRIASGTSGDLIARAADVMLKEGRTLIVVPRETPLNLIHLRNLTTLAEAGAVVLPASPSFYSRPATVEELCSTVTERILSRLGIDAPHFEWGAKK